MHMYVCMYVFMSLQIFVEGSDEVDFQLPMETCRFKHTVEEYLHLIHVDVYMPEEGTEEKTTNADYSGLYVCVGGGGGGLLVCVCVRVLACMHMCVHACVFTCVRACVHVCVCVYIRTYVCMYMNARCECI